MAGSLHRCHFSYSDTTYASNEVWKIREELEEWKEVLLPLASLLKWDQPYYPVITVGAITVFFVMLLYSEMSTLTAISLACMLLGILDYVYPFLRPVVTTYRIWTNKEELEFMHVCEAIDCFRQDALDSWQGLKALRRENGLFFLFVVLIVLATTAWLGSIADNFFLTYLIVNGMLLIPGVYHHRIGQKYTEFVVAFFNKFSQVHWNSQKFH